MLNRLLLFFLLLFFAGAVAAQYVPYPWDSTTYQRTERAFQPGYHGLVQVKRGYDTTVLYWYDLAPVRLADSTLLPGDYGNPVWSLDGRRLLLYGRVQDWTAKPQLLVLNGAHTIVQRITLPEVSGSAGLTYDLRHLVVDSAGKQALAVIFNEKESGATSSFRVEAPDGPPLRYQLALLDLEKGNVSALLPVDARFIRPAGKYMGAWQVLTGYPDKGNVTQYTLSIPDFSTGKLQPSVSLPFLANQPINDIRIQIDAYLEVENHGSLRRFDGSKKQWNTVFYRSLMEASEIDAFSMNGKTFVFVAAQREAENEVFQLDAADSLRFDLWDFRPQQFFIDNGILHAVRFQKHGFELKRFRRAASLATRSRDIKVQLPFDADDRIPVPGTPYLIESTRDEWQVFDMDAQMVVYRERNGDRYGMRFLPLTGTGYVVRYNNMNAELYRAGSWERPEAAVPLQHPSFFLGSRGAYSLVELKQLSWDVQRQQLTGVFTSDSTFVLAQWETGGDWNFRSALRLDHRVVNKGMFDEDRSSFLVPKDLVLATLAAQLAPADWTGTGKAATDKALTRLALWAVAAKWSDSIHVRWPINDRQPVLGMQLVPFNCQRYSGYLLVNLLSPASSVYFSEKRLPGPFAQLAWVPLQKRSWGISEADLSDEGNIVVLSGQEGIQEYDLRTKTSVWRGVNDNFSHMGSAGQFLLENAAVFLNGDNWLDRYTLRPVRRPAEGLFCDSIAFDPQGKGVVLKPNSTRDGYVEIRFNELRLQPLQSSPIPLTRGHRPDSNILVYVPELAFWAHIGEKGISLDTGRRIFNGTPARVYRSDLNGSVNFVQVLPGSKDVVIGDAAHGLFECWNLTSGRRNYRLAITDERNFVLQAPSGFYYATPGAVPQIAFERKGRGIPAQWLDAELNRPDRVLGEIADTTNADVRTLLQMFRAAADKKVAGSLQSGVAGSPQLTVTIAEGSRSVNPTMPIQWTASDGAGPLRSLRLFANQVPVWDTILPPGPATRSGKIMLPLVTGENQIALVATDASGRSSVPAFRRIVYAPRTPVAGRTIVIAVAVDRYADSARNLRFAVKDGKDLLAAMRAADPAHTITDSLFNEAVTAGSLRALRGKLLQTTPEDRVVLSFSGHGMLDSKLEFYYATAAMDFADPKKYGFSFAELEELFTNIPARRRLLLIDACNSGNVDRDTTSLAGADPALKVQNVPAGSRGVVLPKPSGRSSAEIFSQLFSVSSGKSGAEIIAATAGNAFAYESENWQNGVFTYAILKALSESGEYDANYDGGLSVRELKLMVYPLVQQLTGGRQKPLARFENMGYDWNLVPVKKDD